MKITLIVTVGLTYMKRQKIKQQLAKETEEIINEELLKYTQDPSSDFILDLNSPPLLPQQPLVTLLPDIPVSSSSSSSLSVGSPSEETKIVTDIIPKELVVSTKSRIHPNNHGGKRKRSHHNIAPETPRVDAEGNLIFKDRHHKHNYEESARRQRLTDTFESLKFKLGLRKNATQQDILSAAVSYCSSSSVEDAAPAVPKPNIPANILVDALPVAVRCHMIAAACGATVAMLVTSPGTQEQWQKLLADIGEASRTLNHLQALLIAGLPPPSSSSSSVSSSSSSSPAVSSLSIDKKSPKLH
jgi:hypothetical protein